MKNFVILILLLTPLLSFSQENKGLSFETTVHNFDDISSTSNPKARFNFINTSDTSIEILKVLGENRCIVIDSSSIKNYAPQEKGVITVTYNLNCKGPIRKTVSVFTSNNHTISLKLLGKVIDQ